MRLGRVAVLKEFRRRGLGNLIVAELLRQAQSRAGCRQVLIHAQKQVETWYASMGFVAFGDEFIEAGIAHRAMQRDCAPGGIEAHDASAAFRRARS